jgi:hypothetical protein
MPVSLQYIIPYVVILCYVLSIVSIFIRLLFYWMSKNGGDFILAALIFYFFARILVR